VINDQALRGRVHRDASSGDHLNLDVAVGVKSIVPIE
jgi:hypothetical protein